jgi:hypothetical protein
MAKKDRKRQNIDVDPIIQARVRQLAKELGVTESQLWNYFAAEGLIEVVEENSSVWSRLKRSKSIRYKHNIDIDDLLDKLKPND